MVIGEAVRCFPRNIAPISKNRMRFNRETPGSSSFFITLYPPIIEAFVSSGLLPNKRPRQADDCRTGLFNCRAWPITSHKHEPHYIRSWGLEEAPQGESKIARGH